MFVKNMNQWLWLSSMLATGWLGACGTQQASEEPRIAPQASQEEILADPQKEVDSKAAECQKFLDCLTGCKDQPCAERCVNSVGGVQNLPTDCTGLTHVTGVERLPDGQQVPSACDPLCDCLGKCALTDSACFKGCADKNPPAEACICPIARVENPPPSTVPPSTPINGAPPRDQVGIEQVVHAGNGCAQGSKAELKFADDLKTLEVRVDPYTAKIDNGGRMNMLFCTISAVLKVPAGYTLSLPHVQALGQAELASGASGEMHVGYNFAFGAGGNPYSIAAKQGPYTGALSLDSDFAKADLSFLECGKTSGILHTRIRAISRSDTGQAGKVQAGGLLKYTVQWAKCP